jgi:hypothetical protein
MPWQRNKRLMAEGFRDLQYLPRDRCGWDMTLASLAFNARLTVERRPPDLAAWAARHGLPASGRYVALGPDALVLWHGTSRPRAEKIAEHGFFHKGGLWTAVDPFISHSFCRTRSDRFATEGAVVCAVVDRRTIVEGRDFSVENAGEIMRFHHGLPPDLVEYVLLHREVRFTGRDAARRPSPWPGAKFRKEHGRWVPVQKTPVRYSDSAAYSTLEEFARLSLDRLLAALGEVTALEVFSALYAAVRPWDALAHDDVLALIEDRCTEGRKRGKFQTFRARSGTGTACEGHQAGGRR